MEAIKEKKFTPGPWKILYSDVITIVGYVPENGRLLQMPICEIATTGAEFSSDEERANAKLIESAHDLLEALQTFIELDEDPRYHGIMPVFLRDFRQKAKAAIQKATS